MWNETTSPLFLVMVAASILAHVAVIAVLSPGDGAAPRPALPPMLVAIEAAPPPPPPPPPAPEKELPPTVTARPVARAPRPPAQHLATRVATAEPPPAAAAEAADFSGVTLTNEGAAWSSPVGDGTPLAGPIGPPTVKLATATHASSGGGTGDRVVAVGDLSRPPRAPNLDAELAANYPPDA